MEVSDPEAERSKEIYTESSPISTLGPIYVPNVNEERSPTIGQHFDSIEEAFNFYNNYAYCAGFSVRHGSSKLNKVTKEVLRKEFCCYKQGGREKINANGKRKCGLTRVGCMAKLAIVRSIEGFIVKLFNEVHNHVLATPRKVHFLRSHRIVSKAKRSLTKTLAAANIPTFQQISLLELQAGGIENIGCLEQDLYNCVRDSNKLLAGHDADMLYEYFQTQQEKNLNFRYSIMTDNENTLKHCFWSDASSRKSYQVFGDVVVFDTTYNTNRYCMVFAPFVGVNNHGQTILFGCGFLSDESAITFEWLLQNFLESMQSGPPKMIITDQDPAMAKAISIVMPSTTHRYCIWHIMSKFSERISRNIWNEHSEKFKECIWDSESPEEFEVVWEKVVEDSNLTSNEWLKAHYDYQARWIPAYVNNTFSAGMCSSQRVESTHAFFKRYVSKHNSLIDFVTRFTRAVKRVRHNELKLDHGDINERPLLKTLWLMEKQMSEVYTRNAFNEFQIEVSQVMAYQINVVSENENLCIYHVKRVDGKGLRVRTIVEDKSSNYVSCSCKKFESEGIPCRHLLTYFNRKQIFELPDEYILRRWTKSAKCTGLNDGLGVENGDVCDSTLFIRHNSLFRIASNIIDDVVINEELSNLVRQELESLHERVKSMIQNTLVVSCTTRATCSEDIHYKEPLKVRAKGCGKRLKGGKEKGMKRAKKSSK